jgi:hypothetical protein
MPLREKSAASNDFGRRFFSFAVYFLLIGRIKIQGDV